MPDEREQRRQRRAVVAVIVGAVALGTVGIGASVLLGGGPCDGLLPPSFASPPAVVDGGEVIEAVAPTADAPRVAAAVVAMGEELGLGPVRGATAGDADAVAVPVDEAVFVVADDEHVRILDTAIVVVATGRARPEATTVVPVDGHVGMVRRDLGEDVLVARYDEDLTLTSCHELDPPGVVLEVSRGLTLVGRGPAVEAIDPTGRRLWTAEGVAGTAVVDAATTGLLAVLASDDEVTAVDRRTGEVRWRVDRAALGDALADDPLLLAGDDLVVVATRSALVRLDGGDGRVLGHDAVDVPATAAAATDVDVVVAAGAELLRLDGEGSARRSELPGTASALAVRGGDVLVATDAGLVLVRPDGEVVDGGDVPVRTVAVSDVYTLVGVDVGEGFLAFYGPAAAAG